MTFNSPKHIPKIQLFKCWKSFNFYIFLQFHQIFVKLCNAYTLSHDQNWWMDRTSSASPRVIFAVVEVLWRASWSFFATKVPISTKAKNIEKQNSWSQHVMIRELNYESWNALLLPCVLIVCCHVLGCLNNIEVTKVAMATFWNGGLVANTCRGPLECDLFHEFWDLGDFFSRFTRILDKFRPPGTLFHSVSCVCFYDWYIFSLEKTSEVRVQISPSRLQQSLWWFKQQWWWLQNLPESTGSESSQENHPGSQHKFTCGCKEWSGGKLKLHSWMALGNCGDLHMVFPRKLICWKTNSILHVT